MININLTKISYKSWLVERQTFW